MRIAGVMLWAAAAALGFGAAPARAQITTIDPNTTIDGDLDAPPVETSAPPTEDDSRLPSYDDPAPQRLTQTQQRAPVGAAGARHQAANTFERDTLIGAAEGVFGQGASGLAGLIEDILHEQGEPNAYIAGREAGGAVGVGLRYGSGTMFHRVEGERPVYWTGPSLGLDVGGDASNVFVLVYNLYDSQELYRRFPAGEGRVYFVGGFSATYLRRGDVVLIPVRMGVGWRLGANVGYMKFSERRRILPF